MTDQSELVSIMMPAYNAERHIAEAIESVLAQTYLDWELLVVDDGSTDKTAVIVEKFTDSRIKYIYKENGGEASARNVALDKSQGAFIAYLDSDDAWLPHHLETTMSYLQRSPDVDAVYTDGWHIDQDGNQLKSLSSRRRGPFTGRIFEEVVRASDVFGPPICAVLRRNIIEQHHLRYDTNIVIGPDWDFFTRYADFAQFGYVDDHTCLYRIHQTNISVQVDWQRRAGYLAICRKKAIKMKSFESCSLEIRTAVFYDLLINLLPGLPEQQNDVIHWSEFTALPASEQSRLLRLMASKAIVVGEDRTLIGEWFHDSMSLNPSDLRTRLLSTLYKISPALSQKLLYAKQSDPANTDPLGDIQY